MSPKDVTVLSSVDDEPTFQSPSGVSAQPVASPPSMAMSDKWAEQFARMEALLLRGNIFSIPVSAVKPIDTPPLVSKTLFVPPATRPTSPVEVPVAVEAQSKQRHNDDKDKKKKTHKPRKQDKSVDENPKSDKKTVQKKDAKPEKKRERSVSPVRKHSSTTKLGRPISPLADSCSGPESAKQSSSKGGSSSLFSSGPNVTTGQLSSTPLDTGQGHTSTGACAFPQDTDVQHRYLIMIWSGPVPFPGVTVTGKHGSNYRLSLSCNRKSKKLNLTNLFNSQQ